MNRKWVSDVALYLSALLCAFVVWLIAKQGDTETRRMLVPVVITEVPENVIVRGSPSAEVYLIYPKSLAKRVSDPGAVQLRMRGRELGGVAGIGGFKTVEFSLTPGMVEFASDLPSSVRVLGVAPDKATVDAQLATIEAQVSVQTTGAPREGFEVTSVRSQPATVRLTGAPSVLAALQKAAPGGLVEVQTEPLSIAGAAGIVTSMVSLRLPPQVYAAEAGGDRAGRVDATADVRERREERTLEGVAVDFVPSKANRKVSLQPATIDVRVRGPRSKVQALTRESFAIRAVGFPEEDSLGVVQSVAFKVQVRDESLREQIEVLTQTIEVRMTFEEIAADTPELLPPGAR